jgi:hypothetical protein
MMLRTRLLLYVCTWGVTLASQRGGKLRLIGQFSADADGQRGFAAAISEFSGAPVSVMVDGVDEDYRLETLPHVNSSARREMLDRRLRQVSRNALFSGAWAQGRATSERRDDRYLFIILSKHDSVSPWLDLLHDQGVVLAELTVLPVISHALLHRLKLDAPHVLLVSEQSVGLRLSYFQHGELRFSRLTVPEGVADGHAPDIAGEIAKTDLYLNSQRLMSRDTPLNVYLLDPDTVYADLCHQVSAENRHLLCQPVSASTLARALHVSADLLRSSPDATHLAVLGSHRAAVNLAPAAYTQGYDQLRLRHNLYGVAAGIVVSACVASAVLFAQQNNFELERFNTQTRIQQQTGLYRAVQQALPNSPTSPQNLQRAVDSARALYAAPTPITDFNVVSRALGLQPEIAVLRLHWLDHDATDTQLASAAMPSDAAIRALYFDGEVTPFNGDYQAAIARINAFVAHLRNDPAVASVSIVSLPINTDPSTTLDEVSNDSKPPSARFKLKLLLRASA